MKINRILAIASILGAAIFTSCDKGDVEATGMSLDQSSVKIYVGQTATITPAFTPSDGTAKLEWTSSDEKVATVNCGGYVTGIKAGIVTITAKSSTGLSSSCSVNVANVTATSFTLDKTSLLLYEGEAGTQLKATVKPDNVTFPEVSWKSSDPAVATVDANGNVTQVGIGTADIIASLVDGSTATCTVKVTVRVPTEAETVDFWKSDAAGHRGLLGAASDNGKTAGTDGWLAYNDGIATWTENTTGKAREATLELSTGSKITIHQVSAKDFEGDYNFYNYSFKALSNTTVISQSGRKHVTAVSVKAVENPTKLNGHEHNFDIIGLYYDAKLPCSLELTDEGPQIYCYLSKDFQTVSSGDEIAIIPEMTNSTSYSTGYFAPLTFGVDNCNYFWAGWGIADLMSAPKITIGTGDQRKITEDRWFCGFSIVKKGYSGANTSYTTIYQLNYQNKWTYEAGGAYFEKK